MIVVYQSKTRRYIFLKNPKCEKQSNKILTTFSYTAFVQTRSFVYLLQESCKIASNSKPEL